MFTILGLSNVSLNGVSPTGDGSLTAEVSIVMLSIDWQPVDYDNPFVT